MAISICGEEVHPGKPTKIPSSACGAKARRIGASKSPVVGPEFVDGQSTAALGSTFTPAPPARLNCFLLPLLFNGGVILFSGRMRVAYNILFVLFFWLSAPYYFWKMRRRGNWRSGFLQRFGYYSRDLKKSFRERPAVWLHAVSVGEVGVCCQLIKALEPRMADFQIVVSTTTSTGMAELQRLLPQNVPRFYYPADFLGGVRRALRAIKPRAVVLVEAELWPNFLAEISGAKIPLFLVNARISDRSVRGYSRFGCFFRPIFAQFAAVGCQQTADAKRMEELGFPPPKIHLTGNLKFDAARPDLKSGLNVAELFRKIGVNDTALVLVAGSTHSGEEALLAEMLPRWRARFPNLFLVLVPRHFERTRDVMRELELRGTKFICRTDIESKGTTKGGFECLLVNSTGELKYFYQRADVVFIGKSLSAQGGQNPIEPAALGKPVVFGPNMQNFKAVANAFLAERAAIQVQNAGELESAIAELLADEARRIELGQRGSAVVQQNLGATERTVRFLIEELFRRPD